VATNLTEEELAPAAVPESWKPIPPEHMAKYYLLAIDQLAIIQKTLVELALKEMRPVPGQTPGAGNGCIAGLERTIMWLKGYRT